MGGDNGGILRAASVAGASYQDLYYAYHTADDANFRNTTWTRVSGAELAVGSRVGVFGKRIYYQQSDGRLAYVEKTPTGMSAPTVLVSFGTPSAIAPVSEDDVYAVVLKREADKPYGIVEVHYYSNETNWTWSGRIYGKFDQLGQSRRRARGRHRLHLPDGRHQLPGGLPEAHRGLVE